MPGDGCTGLCVGNRQDACRIAGTQRTRPVAEGKDSAVSKDPRAIERQIAELKQRLQEARSRVPKHDVPPGLMVEIHEMEEELAELQAMLKPKSVEE